MEKFKVLAIAILLIVPAVIPQKVAAQDTQNFIIKSFDADYFLNRNVQKTSVLNVIERITAEFPNYDQNHGILRAIPNRYQGHTLSLSVESVKNANGQKWEFSTYKQNDNLVLKIGEADRYIHGTQTFVIRYTVKNVILFLNDHEEFYWDINGDQWPQTFNSVKARIHVAKNIATQLQDRQVCYAGLTGESSSKNCAISRASKVNETVVTVNSKQSLGPYQTLTVVLAFNKGTFLPGPEITQEKKFNQIKLAAESAAVGLPALFAGIFMFRRWRKFGNDPKGRGVIIPEYEPPKGLDVLSSDYLINQKLRNLAISASIIDLAVNRYITIYETKQKKTLRRDTIDYELELMKDPVGLNENYLDVINILFSPADVGTRVKISEFTKSAAKNQARMIKIRQMGKSIPKRLSALDYFIKNPKSVKQGYFGWATLLVIIGALLIFFDYIRFLGLGFIIAAVVVYAFAFIMPARTEKGINAHDALLGLKDYISLAETDRLKFLQSPQGAEKITNGSYDPKNPKLQVKLFESLLPFAMLFGLEKQWAKQFESIYSQPPDWYHGNWTAFNTGFLAGSISNFSSASGMTFVSSSSSSSSGFSGGGSSGGGGGGGGGGGW